MRNGPSPLCVTGPGIMPPTPHPKTPPISPIFTADNVTLVVSREKDCWCTPDGDDVSVVQPDGCGQARRGGRADKPPGRAPVMRNRPPPLCVTDPQKVVVGSAKTCLIPNEVSRS